MVHVACGIHAITLRRLLAYAVFGWLLCSVRAHRTHKTRGYYLLFSHCRFFTAAVRCVPALRVPLVHSHKPLRKPLCPLAESSVASLSFFARVSSLIAKLFFFFFWGISRSNFRYNQRLTLPTDYRQGGHYQRQWVQPAEQRREPRNREEMGVVGPCGWGRRGSILVWLSGVSNDIPVD